MDLKEADKLVWIFTEKLGKISAVAKGAKKSRSKLLSLTLPFCYSNYIMFKGKSLYTISEGEIINSFQDFLNDLEGITYGSYLCELIDIAMVEEESNRELFKVFITCLYLMSNKAVEFDLLARAFEVKLLEATGYGLNLENCCICKRKISSANYINLQYSGGVCSECEKINGLHVQYATYNTLKYLSKTNLELICRLKLDNDVKEELCKVLASFIAHNYSRVPKSLDILNYFEKE